MKKNVVDPERPQITVQNTVHALCIIDNQGCTHSEYVIFIAFPCLQWLINCASLLPYSVLFNHIVKSEDDSIRISWDIVWYDKGKYTAAGRK
jgi:hypothetical protein